jgi:hypothetical protein
MPRGPADNLQDLLLGTSGGCGTDNTFGYPQACLPVSSVRFAVVDVEQVAADSTYDGDDILDNGGPRGPEPWHGTTPQWDHSHPDPSLLHPSYWQNELARSQPDRFPHLTVPQVALPTRQVALAPHMYGDAYGGHLDFGESLNQTGPQSTTWDQGGLIDGRLVNTYPPDYSHVPHPQGEADSMSVQNHNMRPD